MPPTLHIHVHHTFDFDPLGRVDQRLDDILAHVVGLATQIAAGAQHMDQELQALRDEVTAVTEGQDAALAVINGINDRIAAAVAAAQAAGATPEQLQAITDLTASLRQHADPLAAAVVANTPAA
jgi:hypothetical protein